MPTKFVVWLFYHFPRLYVWFRAFCNFLFVNLKLNDLEWWMKKLVRRLRNKKLNVNKETGN